MTRFGRGYAWGLRLILKVRTIATKVKGDRRIAKVRKEGRKVVIFHYFITISVPWLAFRTDILVW